MVQMEEYELSRYSKANYLDYIGQKIICEDAEVVDSYGNVDCLILMVAIDDGDRKVFLIKEPKMLIDSFVEIEHSGGIIGKSFIIEEGQQGLKVSLLDE